MRFVLALLLALAFAPVHAAGITTTAKFFEPTVEQSSQDWEAIKVQHKALACGVLGQRRRQQRRPSGRLSKKQQTEGNK